MINPLPLPIIIIGTGLSGISVAKEFRKVDSQTPLILITQDDGHFYSKPLLSTALQQKKSPSDLVITTKEVLEQQLNATIMTFATVTQIDAHSQTLRVQTLDDSETLPYQKLVFAKGAKPKPLPIVEALPSHYRINSLMDYAKFKTAQNDWQQLAIIGSGLVGCEFAHDFTQSQSAIRVITPDPYPLYGLVPEPVGQALQAALTSKGVTFHTKAHIAQAFMQEKLCQLHLSCQTRVDADGILIAIGLAPDITLAKAAGLAVNQGIKVDAYLECSIPNHFALGDCAEINGQCRQFIAPILVCARALAQTLCGNPTKAVLPLLPITLKVECYPIIVAPPAKGTDGAWHFENQGQHYQGLFYDQEGLLQGYVLSGSYLAKRQEFQLALLANVSQK
ncbi:MAG: NAD(P)/FAD-dependent oxidoreductase [Candidatus Berkiella sp.]